MISTKTVEITSIYYLKVLFNYSYNSRICELVEITNIISIISGNVHIL